MADEARDGITNLFVKRVCSCLINYKLTKLHKAQTNIEISKKQL